MTSKLRELARQICFVRARQVRLLCELGSEPIYWVIGGTFGQECPSLILGIEIAQVAVRYTDDLPLREDIELTVGCTVDFSPQIFVTH
jgi:hypothetical protein